MNERQTNGRHTASGALGVQELDPVCGMKVDPATSKHRFDHGGRIFHFCSASCQSKFAAVPDSYLKPEVAPPGSAKASAIYTCPMHPQIRQDGPGNCPICGMTLEPLVGVRGQRGRTANSPDMTWRFWIGLVLTLPVFCPRNGWPNHRPRAACLSAARHLHLGPVRAVDAGGPVGRVAILSARLGIARQSPSEHVHLDRPRDRHSLPLQPSRHFRPGIFPAGLPDDGRQVSVYFEAAAVITVLVLLGQMLELRARDQTGGAIRALLKSRSKERAPLA